MSGSFFHNCFINHKTGKVIVKQGTIASGTITLHEHTAVTWLPKEDLAALDRAEADLPVLYAATMAIGRRQHC